MAKNNITQFDATAANNTDIHSIDIDEGCAPSNINNAIRELMADLKDVDAGTVALTSPDFTAFKLGGTAITATGAEINSLASSGMTAARMLELSNFSGTFALPSSDGTANQVLQTDGSGTLSFATASSGGSSPISNLKIFTGAGASASSSTWTHTYWNELTASGTTTDRTPNFLQNDSNNYTLITYIVPQALYGKFSGTSGGFNLELRSTTSTATTSSNRSSITTKEYDTAYNHQSDASGADFNKDSIHIQVVRRITTRTYFDTFATLGSGAFMSLSNATQSGGSAFNTGFFMFEEVTV